MKSFGPGLYSILTEITKDDARSKLKLSSIIKRYGGMLPNNDVPPEKIQQHQNIINRAKDLYIGKPIDKTSYLTRVFPFRYDGALNNDIISKSKELPNSNLNKEMRQKALDKLGWAGPMVKSTERNLTKRRKSGE